MKKKLTAVVLSLALAMGLGLTACGNGNNGGEDSTPSGNSQTSEFPGIEDGVLTVAMECSYAPYNWSQPDDSNGAVPIKGSNEYANGYDVMMAKKICEELGCE